MNGKDVHFSGIMIGKAKAIVSSSIILVNSFQVTMKLMFNYKTNNLGLYFQRPQLCVCVSEGGGGGLSHTF